MRVVKPCGVCAYSSEPCANVASLARLISVSVDRWANQSVRICNKAFLTGSFSAVSQGLLSIEEREECDYGREKCCLFFEVRSYKILDCETIYEHYFTSC